MAVSPNGWLVNPPRTARTIRGTEIRVTVADGPAGDVLTYVLATTPVVTTLPNSRQPRMGIVGAVNLQSIPRAGLLVSLLAGRLPLLNIVLVSATISVTLCCAVLLFGRFSLGDPVSRTSRTSHTRNQP